MEKPADNTYPIHELIAQRWSPRAFGDRPVEVEKLHSLFEAARWAPSSFNEQPWGFMVATRQQAEQHQAMVECLSEGNQVWAADAPVLLLSIAKLTFDRNGKPNRHAYHDTGMAVANLVLQATDLGLVVHQMAGFDQQQARTRFAVPEGWDPVAVIAIGYSGDPEELPSDLTQREYRKRKRKSFEEFVFSGTFGEPLPFESRVKRALAGD